MNEQIDMAEFSYRKKHPEEIRYFDISQNEWLTLSQSIADELYSFLHKISIINMKIENTRFASPKIDFNFRLKIYPNRMRDDGVFVAEDREIEPYEGIKDVQGRLCYPSIPQGGYALSRQLPHAFAQELVKRWNTGMSPK
jgi:hypothetical protein